MLNSSRIGIVAPSSKVPEIELRLGVKKIRQAGFSVEIHSQCRKSSLFFAGTDQERADAFFEYAKSPDHFALWCARGGYGAIRLLPLLEKMAHQQGMPSRKLLIGYSDSTALMEFVQKRWGWAALHAPMPSMRKFSLLKNRDWIPLSRWIMGQPAQASWSGKKLEFWTAPPKKSIQAPLVGGNLTVWNSLQGTRFQGNAENSLLFFEDIDESLYRVDRMLQQLLLSGSLKKVRAIVLGNFLNCKDYSTQVLKVSPSEKDRIKMLTNPDPKDLRPLRRTLKEKGLLRKMFQEAGNQLGIPVAFGLPVGHGPGIAPLPLGGNYRLKPTGQFDLVSWDWIEGSP